MADLTIGIRGEREYKDLVSLMTDKTSPERPALVGGLCEGAQTALISCLTADLSKNGSGSLIIVPDEKKAAYLYSSLTSAGLRVLRYSYRDLVMHNAASSHDLEHERLFSLCKILDDDFDAVVTTADAALQFTLPPNRLYESTLQIEKSKPLDLDALCEKLTASGYIRADMVDGAGQFSLRGGIIDLFPASSSLPVRIDLFGDEIERMVYFDPLTQRTVGSCESFSVIPAREVLPDAAAKAKIKTAINAKINQSKDENALESLKREKEALESGTELYCVDKYLPLVYPERACLLDYLEGAFILCCDINECRSRAQAREQTEMTVVEGLVMDGLLSTKFTASRTDALYSASPVRLDDFIDSRRSVLITSFGASLSSRALSGMFDFRTRGVVSPGSNFDLLLEDLRGYASDGWRVKINCENEASARSLEKMLCDSGFGAYMDTDAKIEQRPATFALSFGAQINGFELVGSKYAVISMQDASVSERRQKTKAKKDKKDKNLQTIMSYVDLDVGDYVVHTTHGIGQYLGLFPLTVDGVRRDFIKIQYAGTDVLYLPVEQLDRVSKYIGARGEDGTLKLSKMGTSDWTRAKSKAKAAAKDMAKELIALYAERRRRPGYAFPRDDEMQTEFEEAFEYDETEGQLSAVEDIKSDMQRSYPMDRLLCGDVGYGKTEVALRAAFKAATAGKQVAILVPTTILALQHYRTMTSRMRGFPVHIDMISRFKSESEQQESLRALKRGATDIIVGTHRLLSQDVEFKDLGLLIIDEEQRFGVAHKEKIKQAAKNVDVLTLSATPIPRTLNMALSGIRDMSILEEAPGERVPAQTYVLEYDELLIADALRRELRRGGQVYYLVNRIERQDAVVNRLKKSLPEARIVRAHGRMDKDQLADIWQDMTDGNIDILVSTTIIETGVDLPNVNTLVIEDADAMGLSQLHQIRGRVGRSTRRAYAYFTYPKGKLLSEISEKRLAAIRDFTEFGAGFRIALRDMEIRGVGNLLGSEQHGHMESIGYDLYMKLLEEAVLEEKGEKVAEKPECVVEIAINAYLPETYIKNANQRIDAYKKVSLIGDVKDASDVSDELRDRYGALPPPAVNLIAVSLCRAVGAECNMSRIEYRAGNVLIYPRKMELAVWAYLASVERGKLLVNVSATPYVSLKCGNPAEAPAKACAILEKYKEILKNRQGGSNNDRK